MHPEAFHGERHLRRVGRRPFFEGWYVKLVSEDLTQRWAVIPGVFLGVDGAPREAFVQVLDGSTGNSWYHPYPAEEFHAASDSWDVTVGPNRFHPGGVHLDLPSLSGDVIFTTVLKPWPVTWAKPGIMGPYAWVPAMECYHGVVSFDHGLAGSLTAGGRTFELGHGIGYVEKDWGQAFPEGYVWMQTNHFGRRGMSLSASTAIIPWRKSSFRGFIVGLHVPQTGSSPVLHSFATHTGATTTLLEVDDGEVRWNLRARDGRTLEIRAQRTIDGDRPAAGLLHAPVRTEMHKRVEETLDAQVHIRFRHGDIEIVDTGLCAGLEVHGDIARLLGEKPRRTRGD
jgi:tocopherol cyclase